MKEGDGTIQSKQLNPTDPTTMERVTIVKAMIVKVREIRDQLNDLLEGNEKSLKIAEVPVPIIVRD